MQKIKIKSRSEIEKMRISGQAAAKVLHAIADAIEPGITTYELEMVSRKAIANLNATSSFLNYVIPDHPPFPATICVSVNNIVIHGIPNRYEELREGDIIGVDTAVHLDGFHGDNAFTFPVGKISMEAQRLLEISKDSLYAAIAEAKPGNRLGDISFQLQDVAETAGYSVIQNFSGHGIGRNLHEEPQVTTTGKQGRGPRLRPGMVLAIEAMVNEGSSSVDEMPDGWGIETSDGSLSAFFEHTVAILPEGPEILTGSPIWENR
ncbi:type I methionyl aminopeptidase [Candidatus Poribacteria bacterium]|nr:type I methionyl aminopeptidase [Candidatus Poribacteria bacterium]MYF57221.1 type I methionyl aminopeptidase [Candidatus Poribacteria bacterium]